VHAAFNVAMAVRERVDALVSTPCSTGRPLRPLGRARSVRRSHLSEQRTPSRLLRCRQVDDPAVVLVRLSLTGVPRVSSTNRISRPRFKNAMICSRSVMVCGTKVDRSSKIVGSGVKVTEGASASSRRGSRDLQFSLRLAAVLEGHLIVLVVAVDFEKELVETRHDRGAHAVEAARHLVSPAAELPTGVQCRVYDSLPPD